jgi:hypothetical protein
MSAPINIPISVEDIGTDNLLRMAGAAIVDIRAETPPGWAEIGRERRLLWAERQHWWLEPPASEGRKSA